MGKETFGDIMMREAAKTYENDGAHRRGAMSIVREMESAYHTNDGDGSMMLILADQYKDPKFQYVINGKGQKEPIDDGKICDNIKLNSEGLDVVPHHIVQALLGPNFKPGCSTSDLRMQSVIEAYNFPSENQDYKILACRLFLNNLRKITPPTFSIAMKELQEYGVLNDEFAGFVRKYAKELDPIIDETKDSKFDMLGLSTFSKTYMLKKGQDPIERPQYMFLRLAVGLSYGRRHTSVCRCEKCEVHEHPYNSRVKDCKGCLERALDKLEKGRAFEEVTEFTDLTPEILENIKRRYNRFSDFDYIHASPSLFNIGTKCQQLSSCFLSKVKEDSINGIYLTNWDNAKMSQSGGGIGNHVSGVRANKSRIVTTNGHSNGLVPMLKTYEANMQRVGTLDAYDEDANLSNNFQEALRDLRITESRHTPSHEVTNLTGTLREYGETSRYVDQGGGKRKGASAIYIESWHADFMDVLDMRLPEGPSQTRGTDLFYAVWQSDLFMKRMIESKCGEKKVMWSFFDPKTAPGLQDTYGKEFEELYERYEREGRAVASSSIWEIWKFILFVQQRCGNPYMMYKDTVNRRNNQEHIGTVTGSNLCAEITEVTPDGEIAVCNLASILVSRLAYHDGEKNKWKVDYKKAILLAKELSENLNEVIDRTRYPLPEARYSNLRHRPMAIGIMDLAGLYLKMKLAYESIQAQKINHRLMEAISFGAHLGSVGMAKIDGPYASYSLKTDLADGSKVSRGILVFDQCTRPEILKTKTFTAQSKYFDSYNQDGSVKTFLPWADLRQDIKKYGMRNSLLIAPMPTNSVSKLVGANECFEPYSAHICNTTTLAGTKEVVNPWLVKDMKELGIWNMKNYNKIIVENGSVQGISDLDDDLKERYKTSWEISTKTYLLMAHARGLFIDQSQSLNIFIPPNKEDLHTTIHTLGWQLGLKTGSYYTFTQSTAKKMTIAEKAPDTPTLVKPDFNRKASVGPAEEESQGSAGVFCTKEGGDCCG